MVKGNIVRGLQASFVTNILHVVANGLLILALTRVFLDTGEYGTLFFVLSVFGVALLFADLGTGKSGARYLSEYSERDPTQIPHILKTVLTYRLVSIAVVGGVFVLFADELARLLGQPETAPLLLLGAAYVAFRSLHSFTTVTLQGFNRVDWSSAVSAAASVGQFVFVVGFVALGFETTGAVFGYVAAYGVAALFGLVFVYVKFYRRYDRAATVESGLRRRILEYSVPLTATKGANVLDKRVDTILLGVLVNPVAVGYYTLGKQISDFVMAPAASIGFTIAPNYGQLKERGEITHAARIYETTFEYVLLLYIPAAVGLVIVAEPTIRFVFGTDFLGAIPVVQLFSGFILLQAIDKITNDSLDYLGRSRTRAYSKGFAAVSNFFLNLLLIPMFQAAGAAAATVATYGLMVAVNMFIIHQELSFDVFRLGRTAAGVTAISAVMAGTLLFALPYVTGAVTLVAAVLLGVAVWALLSVLTGLLDLAQVRALVP
ncbi:oligosaccharide flippase family protein [Haloarchaeobius sp. DFWS5]|uniref:oligosaccharide flippase family protein n=1 Tax=Haloarchaeobius sp. DFWS5 TaxID=3446114 RepID=UPI003EBC2C66